MFHSHQERAVKLVDADETHPDHDAAAITGDADTPISPGLRPAPLDDPAHRRTKAMVHAALFSDSREATTIGPYQVLKRLGAGGMGVVYAAYDDKLERKVALKLLLGGAVRHPEARARTLREARALARLSHPNVVAIYQVGEVDDEIFVAMEFLTGPTLRAWLSERPRDWREVLAVFRQAGEGLAAAHRQGVIHRDFKPANVIVGDDGRVRVLDFGLARFGDGHEAIAALPSTGELTDVLLTQTGAVLGTPAYMAREQFAGARGDARSDQFSFCAALYEALYRQRPFAGQRLDALVSEVAAGRVQPVKPGHDVPAWLHRAVVRGLHPDPAMRWPSMDALLAALDRPVARVHRGRVAVAAGSGLALLIGLGYRMATPAVDDPRLVAEREATTQAQAQVRRSQDEKLIVEARAALTRDPVAATRALAKLGGGDPAIREQARVLAAAAEVRGLPEKVLRAGDRQLVEARPLADGGFIARDELGAVWRWKMSEETATEALAPGAATQLLTAADVAVWAALDGDTVRVLGEDREQTIAVGALDTYSREWRLTPDGRTLVAMARSVPNRDPDGIAVHLWDLTRPGAPPQTVAMPPDALPAVAADASVIVGKHADGLRVVRPRNGGEATLKYRGRPRGLSADAKFVLGHPKDRDGVIDVVELATGEVRQVEATYAIPLDGSDALFVWRYYESTVVSRQSLATGQERWQMMLPGQVRRHDRGLVVDAAHERFAAPIGEDWGLGDLRRGELTSFMTVPQDRSPQWAGTDALLVAVRDELRIYRPSASPVQLRQRGFTCALAPGAAWAFVQPWELERDGFTRVELATGATTTFRCPTAPGPSADDNTNYPLMGEIDGTGQVALFNEGGWSCWWDAQHGAHAATTHPTPQRLWALPRGFAAVNGAEVELWTDRDTTAQRWTAAGRVDDLQPNASGTLLAVRSAGGVQVLRATGEVTALTTAATPMSPRDVFAGALAWSPDGARLAVLDKVEGALELVVWDVAGAPRELSRHVLKDSQGRPRNALTFSPSGAAVALTDRHESLLLLDLDTRATRRLAAPDLLTLHMRSETELVGLDLDNGAFTADFAAGEVHPLTPNPELGGSTGPQIRARPDGSLWTCAALGPGQLIEIAAPRPTPLTPASPE